MTSEEYESRQDRYDKALTEKHGIDISGMDTARKVAELRACREAEYQKLTDAVYERRGWTPEGIPTVDTAKRLGIDFPNVLAVLRENGVEG